MYSLHKYAYWPYTLAIKFNDTVIAVAGRWFTSTKFHTIEDADVQFENIAQVTLLEQLVERANNGLKQERHDDNNS